MKIRRQNRIRSKPGLAPLIDVVFLLLIFFLLTSTMMTSDRYDIELPEAENGENRREDPVVVLVNQYGRYAVNNKSVPAEQLAETLKDVLRNARSTEVTVKADGRAVASDLVPAMKALQEAGVETLGIAADPVKE